MEQIQEQRLEALEESITEEDFNDWEIHPVTELLKLILEDRVQGLKEFLESGSFIDEEHGLSKAAEARGAKIALENVLGIEFGEELEEEDPDEG